MEYGKLIAVTGMPGLYELISSKSDGAIVRSLDDQSTKFASTRQHQFSHLESIEIYTVRDNVNLTDVLQAMEASKEALPDEKNANAVKAYFENVYPDMDFEKVYSSDMKKMLKWYSVIKAKGIEIKLTEQPVEEEEEVEEVAEIEEKKPAKQTAKPTQPKEEKKDVPKAKEKTTDEAPKKKAAPKKKKED